MAKKPSSSNSHKASAQPRYHQSARELQAFGTVTSTIPLQLIEPVRLEMTEQLNQLLADTMTLCEKMRTVPELARRCFMPLPLQKARGIHPRLATGQDESLLGNVPLSRGLRRPDRPGP